MKKYQHLDQFDRDRIQALLDSGTKQIDIAKILGVHKGTISREVANRKRMNGHYEASTAEHKARVNRGNSKYQGMKIERNPELKKTIIQELKAGRSPDEIAGRMIKEKRHPRVNKDAIYKWLYSVYGERYCKLLCTKRKKKKKQKGLPQREMIPNRIGLEWRPDNGRHAEGDTFLSPKGNKAAVAIVGLQKEKYLGAKKISDMKTESMKNAIWEICDEIQFDTLTLDNGIENREHEQFGIETYFCDPHAPWQKGFIESSIGLIRRWFIPKGTDLNTVSQEQLDAYIEIINNKYRKSLGYQSAKELVEKRGILKNITSEVALHPRI